MRMNATNIERSRLETRAWPILLACLALGGTAQGESFFLVTGIDANLNPDAARTVFPVVSGFPSTFHDGDRLAGDAPSGSAMSWMGSGTPMFDPNEFGAASFMLRRGSIPAGPGSQIPLMGIEFLGGPLLDLDGDLGNGTRSLIPVTGQTPVAIPGARSRIDLSFDAGGGTVTLNRLDVLSTNEGGPSVPAGAGVTVNVLAGTPPVFSGDLPPADPAAINPAFDDRTGTLTAHASLAGVSRIDELGLELWEDAVGAGFSGSPFMGTQQVISADMQGWLVTRPSAAAAWPALAGQIGGTRWPDSASSGASAMEAHGPGGAPAQTKTITAGPAEDPFGAEGLATLDLGAYLDGVIIPALASDAVSFVYLEAAGFGVNNSFDPVFSETIGYDLVLIAATPAASAVVPLPTSAWMGIVVLGILGGRRVFGALAARSSMGAAVLAKSS